MVVSREEVVEVTSHLLCGIHESVEVEDIHVRECGKVTGKRAFLNGSRGREVLLHATFFLGYLAVEGVDGLVDA